MHTIIDKTRVSDPADLIDSLDELEAYGANLDKYPAVQKAREAFARWETIAAARTAATAAQRQLIADTAAEYVAGTLDESAIQQRALNALIVSDTDSPLFQIYSEAQRAVTRETVRHLSELGDTWVTDVLRPLVQAEIDAIMSDVPWPELVHPSNPGSASMLEWREVARDAHGRLTRLHGIANDFRRAGVIPAGRHEYEWSASAHERGHTTDDLVSFVAHQHAGHGAGIYTEAEVAAAAQQTEPTLPPGNAHATAWSPR